MHILEIDRDGEELLQGFIRAEWPQQGTIAEGKATAWIRMFLRSAALWNQTKPLSASVRIAIDPRHPITTVHSFVVGKRDEQRLRLVLAAFMRTDQMGAGDTESPQHGMEFVGRFLHPNESRMSVARETFKTEKGLAIYPCLRLSDRLPRLFQTFTDLGVPFAYEVQARPWTPERERLKVLLRDISRLADTPGIPSRLLEDQQSLGERLKRATFHIEECISTTSSKFENIVSETLANLFGETFYAERGAAPTIEVLSEAQSEAFAHHVHTQVMFGMQSAVPVAITGAALREDVDRLLSCAPLGLSSTTIVPPEDGPLALSLNPSPPQPKPGGSENLHKTEVAGADGAPFLFVSYARTDGKHVYGLVEELTKYGISTWIDRGLVGGDDWVVELERQLLKCNGILAFVSPSFIASKYCGREVRFGDALNKKIIPIFLQPTELSGGMNFILHAIQRVMMTNRHDCAEIISAVRAHTPLVINPSSH